MTGRRRVPWLALGIPLLPFAGAAAVALLRAAHLSLPACPMKARLGIPCITCGLTRCAAALGAGDWAGAFRWHPVAVVLCLASPLAIAWDLHRAWRGRPYPDLADSPAARLGVAVLLLGTWLLQIVRGI